MGWNRTVRWASARYRPILLQSGIIFPIYNQEATPSGFATYGDADGKFIIGAGDTYNAKDTAGNQTKNATSNTAGAHTGTSCGGYSATGSSTRINNCASAGDHSHTVNITDYPVSQTLKLIKYTGDPTNEIPANVMVLWDDQTKNPLTLTQYYTDEKYFRAGTSQVTPAVDTSTDGSHAHCNQTSSAGSGSPSGSGHGNHSHTFVGASVAFEQPRVKLGFWTNTGAVFQTESGIIALWDGSIGSIPIDWYLCNGQTVNGQSLPDLRNKMCVATAQGNQGDTDDTATGLVASGDESLAWTHGSCGTGDNPGGGSASWHTSKDASHTHTFSINDAAYLPPVFGLYYIMAIQ